MKKIDKKAIGERILQIQKEEDVNSRQFAISIGMDVSQMGKIEKGQLGLSQPAALAISEKYDVPLEWLLYGKGVWKNVPRGQELNDPEAEWISAKNVDAGKIIGDVIKDLVQIKASVKVFGMELSELKAKQNKTSFSAEALELEKTISVEVDRIFDLQKKRLKQAKG